MTSLRARVLALSASAVCMVAVACLDPTEVLVHVKTDGAELCGTLSTVDFQVSGITSSVASKSRPACTNQEIGTLDFVPSGSANDRFTLDVIGHIGDTMSTVRATRVIGFVSHAKLDLQIVLEKSCVDVACKADETCLHGACVPAKVDCTKDRTCGLDAGDVIDASKDACSVVAPTDAIGKLRAAWHFDEAIGSMTTKSTAGDTSSLPAGTAIVAGGPAGCSNALSVTTPASVALIPTFASPGGVNASLSVKRTVDFPTTLLVQRSQTGNTFQWKLVVDQSGKLGVVTGMSSWASTLVVPADMKWHRVGLVWDTVPHVFVDDLKADGPPTLVYPGAGGSVDVGFGTVGATTFLVDELYLFSR